MQLDLTDAVAPALLLGFLAFEHWRFRRDWEAFRVEKLPALDAVTAMREMDKFIRRGFYMDGVRGLREGVAVLGAGDGGSAHAGGGVMLKHNELRAPACAMAAASDDRPPAPPEHWLKSPASRDEVTR